MPNWNPTLQQSAELDTLFMPDLTSLATINAGGGFLQGANLPQADLVSRYDFGPGKFTPGVRAKAGQASYVFYPIDGLVAGDEFTLEYWQRLDIAWASHNSGKALFCLQGSFGGNALNLFNIFNGTATTFANTMANIPARAWASASSLSVASFGLVDFAWNNFAVTLKAGTMRLIINGVERGQITGVNYLPQWADSTREEGVLIGGDFNNQNGVWTSDIRISHTQRVLGQNVTLRPIVGTMAVNATSVAGAVPTNYSGSLKISRYDSAYPSLPVSTSAMTVADGAAALSVVRENCPMTEVPIKAGGVDATHPHLGASGQFSYDWQVVDRSLQWWTDRGLEIYTGADPCPQILGGNVTPDVTHPLMGGTWSNAVPNSFANFATMIADFVARANATGRHITRMGNWNEPDLGSAFWSGTPTQMVDLWHAIVTAVKARDSTVKCGAGEVSNIQAVSWIDAFMAKKASAGTAMDFFALHDYSGSLHSIDQAVGHVGRYATDRGVAIPPVVIGEYNWTDINDETGYERFRGGYWHVRAINAAYALSYLLHGLDVGGVERMTYAHTGPAYSTIRANSKYSSMILVGDNNEHWATFNALKGWKIAANNRDVLTTVKGLPPGVYGLATKTPGQAKYGLVLSNYGWANRRTSTVNVTFSNLPPGTYTLTRYLVDESHSSRWDVAQDTLAGVPYDALAVVETRTDTAAALSSLAVTLPRWSSTFVTIESGSVQNLVGVTRAVQTELGRVITPAVTSPGAGFYGEVLADAPTAYWRLGEASGTVADDDVSTHDGTYVNTPTLGGAGLLGGGSTDPAASFNAAQSEYVDVPNLTIGANATVEGLFKTTSSGRIFSAFHSTTGAHMEFGLTPRLAGEVRNDTGTSTVFLDGPFGKDDGTRHHIALTKEGGDFKFYVDGALVASGTMTGTLTCDTMNIGRRPNGTLYYTGVLDEIVWYDHTLTAGRIAAHVAALDQAESGGQTVGVSRAREFDTARVVTPVSPAAADVGQAMEFQIVRPLGGRLLGVTSRLGIALSRPGNLQPGGQATSGLPAETAFVGHAFQIEFARAIQGIVGLVPPSSVFVGRALQIEFARPVQASGGVSVTRLPTAVALGNTRNAVVLGVHDNKVIIGSTTADVLMSV